MNKAITEEMVEAAHKVINKSWWSEAWDVDAPKGVARAALSAALSVQEQPVEAGEPCVICGQLHCDVCPAPAHPPVQVPVVKALPNDATMLVQRLANSLAVFTKHYETWMDKWRDDQQSSTFSLHTFGDLRNARKLIEEADALSVPLPEIEGAQHGR